jgi:ATP-dependent DNA ligase
MSDLLNKDNICEFVRTVSNKAAKIDLDEFLERANHSVLCEPKIDGVRVFLFKAGDSYFLATKHSGIYNKATFPGLFASFTNNETFESQNLILDCELLPHQQTLNVFDILSNDSAVYSRAAKGYLAMNPDQPALRELTLIERKKILENVVRPNSRVTLVPFKHASSKKKVLSIMQEMVQYGYEGIVAKGARSLYDERNSWLKLKKSDTIDVFVTAVDKASDSYKATGKAHAWHIAVYKGREVVDLGKVGSFTDKVDPSRIKEGTVLELQFQEIFKSADKNDNEEGEYRYALRHAFVVRIREDKIASECDFSQLS